MHREFDVEKWNRRAIYEHFRTYRNPFFSVTANLDVTGLYNFCKASGTSFSLAFVFCTLVAANKIREFKLRFINQKIYEFDRIHATQTILLDDESFAFCYLDLCETIEEFCSTGRIEVERSKSERTLDAAPGRLDLIYYSVIPWVEFTSFSNAMTGDPFDSVPRMVFGKINKGTSRVTMPLSVEVNHMLLDGIHVGRFYEDLEDHLSKF